MILRHKALRAGASVFTLLLATQLGGCLGSDKSAPLGTTEKSSSLETKTQRDDYTSDKIAAMAGDSRSFAGAVIADEPTAAYIGRGALERGGNAADAAAAMYFALSVTYPAAASLGGGGICLARDAKKGEVSSISFLPKEAAAGGSIAVPGNVRGMAYIQARYGRSNWTTLVAPAERIAATGFQVSRATANQLTKSATLIGSAPDLNALYANESGMAYAETDNMKLPILAATLGRIRARGVVGFYQGETAQLLVEQSAKHGGALSALDLSGYRPDIAPAQAQDAGELQIMYPAANTDAGTFAKTLWAKVQGAQSAASLADAANQIASVSGAATDMDYGSTSFVAVDNDGGAVACAITMNGAFGIGHVASGTGIVFAATPRSVIKGQAANYLVPLLAVRAKSKEGLFASAAAAGGPKATAALESVFAAALTGEEGAAQHALDQSPADAQSPANAILCPKGLPHGTCSLNVNPRGAGVGFSAVSSGS